MVEVPPPSNDMIRGQHPKDRMAKELTKAIVTALKRTKRGRVKAPGDIRIVIVEPGFVRVFAVRATHDMSVVDEVGKAFQKAGYGIELIPPETNIWAGFVVSLKP